MDPQRALTCSSSCTGTLAVVPGLGSQMRAWPQARRRGKHPEERPEYEVFERKMTPR